MKVKQNYSATLNTSYLRQEQNNPSNNHDLDHTSNPDLEHF